MYSSGDIDVHALHIHGLLVRKEKHLLSSNEFIRMNRIKTRRHVFFFFSRRRPRQHIFKTREYSSESFLVDQLNLSFSLLLNNTNTKREKKSQMQ